MILHRKYNIREITDIEGFKKQMNLYSAKDKIIIQTCRRLEVYSGTGEFDASVARHLFRLVCGLESVFIGDTAIKGQVKKAYLESVKLGGLPKSMHKLFQWALYVGKLVRSVTDIDVGAVSYPQSVILLLKAFDSDLSRLTVTVVGVNDITVKLLKWLTQSGVKKLNLVNRTLPKVENIAERFGAEAFQLDQLPVVMTSSDVLILCTSSSEYLLRKKDFTAGRKQCVIDLSWPQNADPEISELVGVQLHTIDNLEHSINQNLEKRKESVHMAELIIEQELCRIMYWQKQQFARQDTYLIPNNQE